MVLSPSTIDTFILPNFDRVLRDNLFMSTALFEYLWSQVDPVDGGSTIREEIAYLSTPNADNFGGGVQELPATLAPVATEAQFPPCYYFYSLAIPDTTVVLNEGEGMIIDIIAAQYEQALMSLNDKLGTDAYGDSTVRNGAPTLSGLGAVCTSAADPGGGAFGGISRIGSSGPNTAPVGNAPWWNAAVFTINGGSQTCWKGTFDFGAVTTLGLPALTKLITAATVGQYRPEVLFAGSTAWVAFANLLMATVRQEPANKGEQGFSGLSFMNTVVVQDDKQTAGSINTINNMLKFRPWRGGFFRQLPWRQPPNQLINIKYGLLIANMCHQRPNTMAVVSGITG